MDFKDYYKTLGVAKTATDRDIKQAYRKLARKFHPDVNPGDKAAEARFKDINEAYEVLGDQSKRSKYDELGANWKYYEQAQRSGGAQGASGGVPFEEFFRSSGASAPPGSTHRTVNEEELRELFGDQVPFSDFFKQVFGGAEPGRRTRPRRGARARKGEDLEQHVEISLDEAFSGVTREISVRQNGHTKTLTRRIPAGVKDGSRVRVAGEGEPGHADMPAGDLYLTVRVTPHPVFTRDGADLHVRLAVPVTTAVLGGSIDVPAPGSRTLRTKVPPLTQSGQRIRLRNQGMPILGKPDERGSLFVTIEPQLPRALSDDQRRLYEELARSEAGK